MLPNFLIIGAARAGTTSIYHNLSQHPEVFMSDRKEINFFNHHWDRGLDWYRSFFSAYAGQKMVGEASVRYTFPYPAADKIAERIAEALDHPRLLYIVRHPVDRTYSHYWHNRNTLQREDGPFEQAIEERSVYLGTSCYFQRLSPYLRYFSPEQICVLIFEEFFADPEEGLRTIFRFLGVDSSFVPRGADVKTNVAWTPRSRRLHSFYVHWFSQKTRLRQFLEPLIPHHLRARLRNLLRASYGQPGVPPMSVETRERLLDYFRPENDKLAEFLGRDLSLWDS